MSKHITISPNEAADRLAIRELVEAYAHCADRRDAKGQMSLFTPSQELHSREALAPVFADLNKYAATMHFIGQSTILSLTVDQGTGEAYCLVHHLTVDGGKRQLMIAALRYYDTFAKMDGTVAVCGAIALRRLDRRTTSVMIESSQVSSITNIATADQERLVIKGATGMVGGYALRYALEDPAVASVTAIGRRNLRISHPKLKEVLHGDFADCSALAETLLGSECSGVLPGHVYRSCIGCGAPRHNGGLHDRVCASSPPQQPRRGVLIVERERRRPYGTKSACLRALQG